MAVYGIWAILVGYIIITGQTPDKLGNIILTSYTGIGLFWLYMEMAAQKSKGKIKEEKYRLDIYLPIPQEEIEKRSPLFFEKLFIEPTNIKYVLHSKNIHWQLEPGTDLRRKGINFIAYCNSNGRRAHTQMADDLLHTFLLNDIGLPETLGKESSVKIIEDIMVSLRVTVDYIRKRTAEKKINLIPPQRGTGKGYLFNADICFLSNKSINTV
jgi:hypothetical protein